MGADYYWNAYRAAPEFVEFKQIEQETGLKIYIKSSGDANFRHEVFRGDLNLVIQPEANHSEAVLKVLEHVPDLLIFGNVLQPGTALALRNPNFKFAGDWFTSPVYRFNGTPDYKNQDVIKTFDFLVGSKRGTNTQLFKMSQNMGVLDRCLFAHGTHKSPELLKLDHRPGHRIGKVQSNTSYKKVDLDFREYFRDNDSIVEPFISRVTPQEIYKNTLASIVRETITYDDPNYFFTEKIAKPLHAGRVFFLLGNQYLCRKFQELGFHMYYDPSYYDDEPDWFRRAQKFFELVQCFSDDDIRQMYVDNQFKILANQSHVKRDWNRENFVWLLDKIRSHRLVA